MRITMLGASLSRDGGGVTSAILGAANALADQGETVSLVAMKDDHSLADRPTDRRLATITVRVQTRLPIGTSRRMLSALHNTDAEVLHSHGLWLPPSRAVLAWQRQTNRPTVISPHGMLDPWALNNSAWKKRLATWAFERANLSGASCLHALNHAEAEAIRAFGICRRIAVIPNGVSLPNLGMQSHKSTKERRKMLFLGRLHPKKGLIETLKAWSLLDLALRDEWQLVVVGWDDGDHQDELKCFAQQILRPDDVDFTGPLFGVAKDAVLRTASAFILASHSEGLPIAVLEAWSYALPVFMSRGCNLPDGFAADAAIEAKPDPKILSVVLSEHLRRNDLSEMGLRGRRLVERNYTWTTVARRLSDLYGWLRDGGTQSANVELYAGEQYK